MTQQNTQPRGMSTRAGPGVIRATAAVFIGVMAGFFFAFSVVVMPGLERMAPLEALPAMQAINDSVRTPWFGLAFFGAQITSLALIATALVYRDGLPAIGSGVAGVIYISGVLFPTAQHNVPLNTMLAPLDPEVPANADRMVAYIEDWSYWNGTRTIASLIALMLVLTVLVATRRTKATPA